MAKLTVCFTGKRLAVPESPPKAAGGGREAQSESQAFEDPQLNPSDAVGIPPLEVSLTAVGADPSPPALQSSRELLLVDHGDSDLCSCGLVWR